MSRLLCATRGMTAPKLGSMVDIAPCSSTNGLPAPQDS
jgi:hypothetical protein